MKKIILAALLLSVLNAEIYKDVRKRCYKGSMIDCYNLATMYQYGNGVIQEYYRAARFFRMVCKAEEPKDVYLQACYDLGFIYYLGSGAAIRQDFLKATKFFSKACNGGNPDSCHQLGIMYSNGDGVKQNYSTAKEYFSKACDLGSNDGCKDYSELNKAKKQ